MNQLIKAQKEQFLQITGSLKTNEFHETKRRALQRYAVHLSRERTLFLGGLSSPWVMETTSERNPRRARGKRAALKPPQAASHTGLETDTAASKRRRLGGTVTLRCVSTSASTEGWGEETLTAGRRPRNISFAWHLFFKHVWDGHDEANVLL